MKHAIDFDPRMHRLQRQDAKSRKTFKIKRHRSTIKGNIMRRYCEENIDDRFQFHYIVSKAQNICMVINFQFIILQNLSNKSTGLQNEKKHKLPVLFALPIHCAKFLSVHQHIMIMQC